MAISKIEWTDYTFNAWRGCTKVSDGCKNCYAETVSKRNPAILGTWGDNGTRAIAAESYWNLPHKWNRKAAASGTGVPPVVDSDNPSSALARRPRVFCASLADVFEDRPELEAPRARLFELIASTPNLDWLLLTKRPENLSTMFPFLSGSAIGSRLNDNLPIKHLLTGGPYLPNVWLGVSVENQATADQRIPLLLQIPAAIRFLSIEPLLAPIDLSYYLDVLQLHGRWVPNAMHYPYGLHWVICGGESGPHARPMHPDWPRNLRDQCAAANVPFFFKQWGEWSPNNAVNPGGDLRRDVERGLVVHHHNGRELDGHFRRGDAYLRKVGKHAAGRTLDGRIHSAFPQVREAHGTSPSAQASSRAEASRP